MSHALQLLAGPKALAMIRERGLEAAHIDVVVGASGGPKWLVLAGLDRVVFGEILRAERSRPLHLIGSSIGSWRMACLAQRDPVAALERLEAAYIDQRYTREPPPSEVSRVGAALLDVMLGDGGDREILENPRMRLHVITARSRGLVASERRSVQLAGLALAALANAASRRALGTHFQRVIFGTGDAGPFRDLAGFSTRHVPLTRENLRPALVASGSIPLVLDGVRIPGAPPGVYRDGGVIDYHPCFDFGPGEGIVLYPHFYPHITPGWFDKGLSWRKPPAGRLERVLLLAPSAEFVAGLPGGKIPDRKDFYTHSEVERMRIWRLVRDESRRLGDEFAELMASGRWMDRVRPLALD